MLIFLSDEMMTKRVQKLIKIYDMTPIALGIAEGKLWSINKTTFHTIGLKRWGGNNVFGMIYNLPINQINIRALDAYYGCSLSVLLKNHIRDMNHRKQINVIPIDPIDLQHLAVHKYNLFEPVQCWAWIANLDYPAISKRVQKDTNRILHGANVQAIKEAFQLL